MWYTISCLILLLRINLAQARPTSTTTEAEASCTTTHFTVVTDILEPRQVALTQETLTSTGYWVFVSTQTAATPTTTVTAETTIYNVVTITTSLRRTTTQVVTATSSPTDVFVAQGLPSTSTKTVTVSNRNVARQATTITTFVKTRYVVVSTTRTKVITPETVTETQLQTITADSTVYRTATADSFYATVTITSFDLGSAAGPTQTIVETVTITVEGAEGASPAATTGASSTSTEEGSQGNTAPASSTSTSEGSSAPGAGTSDNAGTTSQSTSDDLSRGAQIGIGVGVGSAALLLGLAAGLCFRRRKQHQEVTAEAAKTSPSVPNNSDGSQGHTSWGSGRPPSELYAGPTVMAPRQWSGQWVADGQPGDYGQMMQQESNGTNYNSMATWRQSHPPMGTQGGYGYGQQDQGQQSYQWDIVGGNPAEMYGESRPSELGTK